MFQKTKTKKTEGGQRFDLWQFWRTTLEDFKNSLLLIRNDLTRNHLLQRISKEGSGYHHTPKWFQISN